MDVAIIGAGLIGRKRALALPKGINLAVVCDIDKNRLSKFTEEFKCRGEIDYSKVIASKNIEAVIISTINKYLAEIAEKAILAGKAVLIEKPGARNIKDLQRIVNAYKKTKTVVMFGYNHRFHSAIIKAKQIVDSNNYGPVLFIRARYGHGGRLGYEKEWRFNKDFSGGGELLDQGAHLIDLVNYFAGPMDYQNGVIANLFWQTKLEDTSFIILKAKNRLACLSATCVEWKNIFCFEIMLKNAKIQIDGKGGSYGQEKLTLYKMKPEMGPPVIKEYNFKTEDLSWKRENQEFFERIQTRDYSNRSLSDAEYVLKIIERAYQDNS